MQPFWLVALNSAYSNEISYLFYRLLCFYNLWLLYNSWITPPPYILSISLFWPSSPASHLTLIPVCTHSCRVLFSMSISLLCSRIRLNCASLHLRVALLIWCWCSSCAICLCTANTLGTAPHRPKPCSSAHECLDTLRSSCNLQWIGRKWV